MTQIKETIKDKSTENRSTENKSTEEDSIQLKQSPYKETAPPEKHAPPGKQAPSEKYTENDALEKTAQESVEGQKKATRKRWHIPRWALYALAGLGVATLVVLAFRPAPVVVEVGEVTQAPLKVTIDAEGKTQVQERYVVAAPVAGRLQRIELEAGDTVGAGKLIAQIDPLPLTSQVRAAQARLQQLQAELAGVETQRPKSQEISQAEARLRAAEAEQDSANAEVADERAALEQAQRDLTRAQSLEASGAITRQQREAAELNQTRQAQALETAQQKLKSAIANVAAAQAAIPILRAEQRDPDYLLNVYKAQIAGVQAELTNLSDEAARTTIPAPVSGTVLSVPEASARFVQAGDALVEIGDAGNLELAIDVLSADAVAIQPGDTILVEQWGGPDTLTATVNYIEPAAFTEVSALGVEEQRVNVIGTFTSSTAQLEAASLGDGYRIEARIVIWQDDAAVQVPTSALYRCDTEWCVFSVENDRATLREVVIGQRSPTAAVVESGLTVGDTVILHPNEQIEAGSKVQLR
ncbi:MAG: HlyD family efflux transporter periplasmic adaptor subunit [Cyanobacteria bacterium P01_D01_bin.105]